MSWSFLFLAGCFEVVWAIGLKFSDGFSRLAPSLVTIVAMGISFLLLAQALKTIPVGTGYAVWTGIGAVGTALLGIMVLGEPASPWRISCILLIVAGIVGLGVSSGFES